MLEYIFDFTDIYTLYSVYAGLLLGITLQLLLIWTVKEANFDFFQKKIEFTLTSIDFQIQKKSRISPNHILIWIIKYIRNKAGTGDDKEATLIFLQP